MALRDDLIEAFSDSIDRLNNGEDLNSILDSYPELANQLRPMLEAGLLLPRARFTPADVNLAQEAIEPAIQQTIATVFGGGWNGGLFRIILVMAIGLGLILTVIQLNLSNNSTSALQVVSTSTETDTMIPATATIHIIDTISPTETRVSTAIPNTDTPTSQPEAIEIDSSATHTATAIPKTSIPNTNTPTDLPSTVTPVPSSTTQPLVVIQGPIEGITSNTISIFNQTIEVLPDNPILQVIQIGDVVRIEGKRESQQVISLFNIDFINVTVVEFDGEVWRGDDCAIPPPAWAEGEATEWLIACTSNQPQSGNFTSPPLNNSNNSSAGQSSNNNNDDDDDGDDDD